MLDVLGASPNRHKVEGDEKAVGVGRRRAATHILNHTFRAATTLILALNASPETQSPRLSST